MFRSDDAELISFGIPKDRPIITAIDIGRRRGPQRNGASDGPFVVHHPQIQVHPVLRSLGFGDLQEEQRYRSHVEVDVAVLIGSLDTSAQQPAPPIRKDLRVACVEAHPADRRDHILFTVVMPTLSVGLRLLAGCWSSSALARSSNQRSAFNSTARWRQRRNADRRRIGRMPRSAPWHHGYEQWMRGALSRRSVGRRARSAAGPFAS